MTWHSGYSVILGLCAATVAYELWAVYTQARRRRTGEPAWPTITEAVRRLMRVWPWTKWAGTVLFAVLALHFWWGLW